MFILYNILQLTFLTICLPIILLKIAFTPKYRQRILNRLGLRPPSMNAVNDSGPRIWIHALSVGEVMSSTAMVRGMRRRFPDWVIIYSTSTATGAGIARQKLGDMVDYLITYPLDLFWSVRQVVKGIRPDLFVLIETDLWPNMLSALSRRGTPIILLNGRISGSSFIRYKRFSLFFGPIFSLIDKIAMQSRADEERMIELGISPRKIYRVGNLKFDQEGVQVGEKETGELRRNLHIPPGSKVVIAGSTHAGEEEIILSAYGKLIFTYPDLFLLMAPRDPGRADEVKRLAQSAGLEAYKRTELPGLPESNTVQVVVLDTLGELSKLYALATVAFIGGSLVPKRGHNVLEVAAHAKPVVFGPHTEDFKEAAAALIKRGGGYMVNSENELVTILELILSNDVLAQKAGERAFQVIEENRGAVEKAVDLISKTITRNPHLATRNS
ncbi:MAG: 3-deoxy-D-manno-octulosonic acid transferase [Thermodesulfobacteriota bacterium]|nr:3-deoxy-D-manno-octulosonic acid transferase [Thermodesulfobacteriota bacterium]